MVNSELKPICVVNKSKNFQDVFPKKTHNIDNDEKLKLVWVNIIVLTLLHLSSLYGLFLVFTSAKLLTIIQSKYCALKNAWLLYTVIVFVVSKLRSKITFIADNYSFNE